MKRCIILLNKFYLSLIIFAAAFLQLNMNSVAQTTQTYTSSGEFTVPAGVATLQVECWGAGGGGGSSDANKGQPRSGGGGGGGGYSKKISVSVTPGVSYPVNVGIGGAGGVVGPGGAGGSSNFSNTFVIANGGSGGTQGGYSGVGKGGILGTGDIGAIFVGGDGAAGANGAGSGGGGGGAGSGGSGGNASGTSAGNGTANGGGNGGEGLISSAVGNNGYNYGGGGSGGYADAKVAEKNGGSGANGQVKITYTCPTYYLYYVGVPNSICAGNSAVVNLTVSPAGTYTLTYDLSAPNASTGNTAVITTAADGKASFTTPALTNGGTTSIIITKLSSGSGNGATPLCFTKFNSNNTAAITVNSTLSITLGSFPSVCQTTTATSIPYIATTGNPTQWKIVFDATAISSGFSSPQNSNLSATPGYIPVNIPNSVATGVYNGILTVSTDYPVCTSSNYPITVTIGSIPNQPSTITGSITSCQGTTQTYNVTNIAGVTYTWVFPSGWNQTAGGTTNSVTVVVGSGNGNVKVTPSNACGNGTARTLAVTVNPIPTITGILTVNSGSTTLLTGSPSGGTWSSGTTSVATVNSSGLVSGVSSGTSIITYTGTNGCSNTATVTVSVGTAPTITSSLTASSIYGTAGSYTITTENSPTSYSTSSLPTGFSLSGNVITVAATAAAGNYNITINATNAAGTGSATLVYTVAQKSLTVVANDKSRVYNVVNPTFDGTLSGVVSGDGITSSYNTAATQTSNVGTYAITAILSDPNTKLDNYSVTNISGTLTITPASATISLSNLSKTYNGTAQGATVSTNPTGLAVTETYGGSTTVPTAAGSYAVVAAMNNTNYSATNATGTLVIDKANQTITWANPANITYGTALGATQLNATVTGVSGGSAAGALTYTPPVGTLLNAGSQTLQVDASATTNYNSATKTVTLVVDKATPTATLAVNNSSVTYDGTAKAATVGITTSSVPGSVSNILTGGLSNQTAAGTYAVTADFVPTDAANYNTLTGLSAGDFVINKATPTLSMTNSPVTYDGTAKSALVSCSVAGNVSNILTGGAANQTNAGTYAVTADFVPTDATNYRSITAASAGNFVIDKATPTLSVTNSPVTYNGSAQSATVSGTGGGTVSNIKYDGSYSVPTNAGTYAVTADIAASMNYSAATNLLAGNFIIKKASLTITANNRPKCFGETINFAGTEFTSSGLISPDLVTSVTLNSDGAAPAANSGNYPITSSAAAGSGLNNYTINYNDGALTVNALPTPTAGSNSPICARATLNLTSSGGTSYSWTGPNGFSSTNQNPGISNAMVAASGIYTVTVTNENGCIATATTNVTINALPTPTFINPSTSVCANDNVVYETQAGQTNYVWNVPGVLNTDYTITSGGIGATSNIVTLKWITSGSKTVSVNYTNGNGCIGTTAQTATTVHPVPQIGTFN